MSGYEGIAKAAAQIVSDKLGCVMSVRYDQTHGVWVFWVEGYNEPTLVQHHVSDTDTVEWLVKHLEIAISLTRKEG